MGIFEKTVSRGEALLELIPQRAPIVMVDEFLGIEGAVSATRFTIAATNIFCDEGVFSECGVIEHVAQSAALRMGYLFKSSGKEVPLGFIGAVTKCTLHSLPKVGETLYTEITLEQELLQISLISAIVKVGEQPIATCQMKIFLQE
ncbi:MAG: hydroxymyristoyl-ACP dehydratase [Phocaeicola sp.]